MTFLANTLVAEVGRRQVASPNMRKRAKNTNNNKQLKRNQHYLSFLKKEVIFVTYQAGKKKLYLLSKAGKLDAYDKALRKGLFPCAFGGGAGIFGGAVFKEISVFKAVKDFIHPA